MIDVTISVEERKLEALEYALKKQNTTVRQRLKKALEEIYQEAVPQAVREYVDSRTAADARRRRPSGPSVRRDAAPGDKGGEAS